MSHGIAPPGTVYKPADLARHPYFKRTKQRKARWYCSLCGNPSAHFDCAGATRHELTPRHVASLAHAKLASPSASKWENINSWTVAPANDGWGPAQPVDNWSAAPVRKGKASAPVLDGWGSAQPANDWDTVQPGDGWGAAPNEELNGWGAVTANDGWDAQSPPAPRKKRKSATPLEDLRNSEAHQVLECQDQPRRTWRIRMWIKELVLAAGGEWIDTEADVEPPMPWNWDDEPRPDLAWGLAPTPGAEGEESDEVSERAMAVSAVPPSEGHVTEISSFSNFSHPHPWIERMAERFGWDAATIRDRNNFYTLPMKEKKARVQQMIYEQSPSRARNQAKLRQPARRQPQPQPQPQRQGQPARRRR